MSDRDYAKDMRAVIDEASEAGPYLPKRLATEIVEKLRANDLDLLEGWLSDQAEHFIWQAINDRDRSARSHAAATRDRTAFKEAAEAFEGAQMAAHAGGAGNKLRDFLSMRFTVSDGSRRALATLTGADLMYVGDQYKKRERENAFWKVFAYSLAKKVGDGTVGDHFTNGQLSAMFSSIS
jgi:hypothetical protein